MILGEAVDRQQERLILRLWRDWCRLWPEHYGHESLQVKPEGYDPVFDVIPSQTYKDFYFEVVRGHPTLKHINAFEVIDTALNQIGAPEAPVVNTKTLEDWQTPVARAPIRAVDHVRVTDVELVPEIGGEHDARGAVNEADTA
jgi:hypothetical protein